MQNYLGQGFLLTRQSKDVGSNVQITLWLKTAKGPVKVVVNNELCVFFIEATATTEAKKILTQQNVKVSKTVQLKLKTFSQENVSGFYFKSLRDFYLAREVLTKSNIKCYEDDFRPEERFLMERFITANVGVYGQAKLTPGYLEVNHARCKPMSADIKLTVVSVDIECSFDGELYSIGLYSDSLQKVLMIGEQQPTELGYIEWLPNEVALLNRFVSWVSEHDPDILIGWNVINFDMSLLQKRCDLYNVDFAIGRDNSIPHWRKNKASEQRFLEIAGRVVLDGIDLLKTATYNFPSFSLENVAKSLLGIGKKVDDVDNRVKEITDNFRYNKPKLAAYNLEDCRLVWLIFEHTQLMEFAMLRAQLTGLAIDRIGGSVAAFTNLYLPKLHRAGYVAPNMGDGRSDLVSPGGYVMDSIPGLYNNVLVLDFKSLYPSIIRTFNIDPMGLIEGLKASNEAIPGFDGAYFSRNKHFLPEIINSLWQERDKAKQDKNSALSQAIKIIMNSFYGILGSTGCRFFDPRLSGSITKRSHQILKETKQWIEDKGYTVIYGDTDSIFVHVDDEADQQTCNLVGKTLQDFINNKWQQQVHNDYQLKSQLEIEFETHFVKFFMPTIRGAAITKDKNNIGTKKRYAGIVDGELKFKGLETVRSDWTDISKVFQQELYRRIFNDLPVKEYIQSLVGEIKSGIYDDKLVYRKKLRRKLEDYANTPPHIKAAKLGNEYSLQRGHKIKYKRGSKIEYVMSVNGVIPVDLLVSPLDYDHYIDKQIKPIADDILPFIGNSFDDIANNQLGLF